MEARLRDCNSILSMGLFQIEAAEPKDTTESIDTKSLCKSVDCGLNIQKKNDEKVVDFETRKTSLPNDLLLIKSWIKPKDWIRDNKWMKPPAEGIVEDDKVDKLKAWFDLMAASESLKELEEQVGNFTSMKPGKSFTALSVDPYHPIRCEKYLIEEPENLEHLYNYTGDCQLSLSNGDTFTGTFQDGQRDGYGILKFGLINKRKFEMISLEGTYESESLQGKGVISYANGDKLICNFINGVPNGPAKLFDAKNHIKQV